MSSDFHLNRIRDAFSDHMLAVNSLDLVDVCATALALVRILNKGGKVLICGCGGSAADAQHFSSELMGRFNAERGGIPAIALTTDSSLVTALSNDFGFGAVFARQVHTLGTKDDAFIGISTSGESLVVLEAASAASALGMFTVALTGSAHNTLATLCDDVISVKPDLGTARIQEAHGLVIHLICQIIDEEWTS